MNLFGHAHPEINAAIADQLGRLEHVMLAGFTHAPAVELAERLAALAPGRLGHAFFASDGASATEIALKMAFHYWANRGRPGKNRFVALAGGYHGETVGALAVTDVADLPRCLRAAAARRALVAPFPGAMRGAIEALEKLLAERTRRDRRAHRRAAGAGRERACASIRPQYLQRARELCTRHEVLLIADEIMTGFGRTGTMFACEQAGIAPDLLCLSKGITGGYLPLSCVLVHRRGVRRVLRRRRGARLPALALVHRQRARLPRRAAPCSTSSSATT